MRVVEIPVRATVGILAALFVIVPGRARADGAFPDAQNILTPADRPQEIVMPTNFGIIFTVDAGKTWLWTCEQDANAFGWLYQAGVGSRHRMFTVAGRNLVYSDDLACGWNISGGGITGQEVVDAWVDRAEPDRVLAIGVRCCEGGNNIYSIFESTDGGTTFGAPLYAAPSGDTITGIETAMSDPRTIYMTMSVGPTYQPTLAVSSDRGATWRFNNLTTSLGMGNTRLIAVDAQNPNKVFLLWNDPVKGQGVAVTEDAGTTASIRLPGLTDVARDIKAFVRTSTGALLLAADLSGIAVLYRSRDGGNTFEMLPDPPGIRGFSERNGLVYAATNNFGDGYELGTSSDDGAHWTPVMSYADVRAIAGCLKGACQTSCEMLAGMLWPVGVCSADVPTVSGADAGSGVPDAGADGSRGGGGGSGGSGGGTGAEGGTGSRPAKGSGGGCAVPPGQPDRASIALGTGGLFLLLARRRARRQGGAA